MLDLIEYPNRCGAHFIEVSRQDAMTCGYCGRGPRDALGPRRVATGKEDAE